MTFPNAMLRRMRGALPSDLHLTDAQLSDALAAAIDPRFAWDTLSDDHGSVYGDIEDALSIRDLGHVEPLWALRGLGRVYAGNVCVEVDRDGEPKDWDAELFATEDEARAAWAESLEAALAKARGGEE